MFRSSNRLRSCLELKKSARRGWSSGVLAPMASVTLVRTISFSIYQRAKYTYSGWIKQACGFDVLQHVNKQGTYPNLYSIACFGAAGASAGSCITLLACPFELTKLSAQVSVLLSDQKKLAEANCRATNGHQVAASYQNKGTFKTMSNIIRHRGALGLYTGFNLHLYPIDSAKSIYQRNSLLYSKGQQVEPPPKIEFFKKHMYRGLGVSMGRSCAVNAIFFSAFEFMKKHVNSLDDN
ncbi:putative mitochondrial carrier [Colletotrichum sp. SAR11_59]|nr:putative mitochondrial carrier [Colletotrichum sp. SAR 10_71]KAI8164228.1 putative mitochondrial carrier [Colletotrichum sp. SAR 10_65]KAI8175647.1 putative mitochondrial carrier [Colletotrichum sp. SAR 10_70]KAI8177356.1 putative mitochondrial carrier [Colletotrichum sp. SAR 10_75]KAI8204636.1 putative mitochondrial carrier [Colletotrichum sp. SAR 10_76]KAI8219502.1 putative mitochondrial carrier [Colletotrichum sp. SAR 10_77]KAI8226229.1 putative mitochondrial carrier [Colletotrichum sp.